MNFHLSALLVLAINFLTPSQIDPSMFVGKWTYVHDYESGLRMTGYSNYLDNRGYESVAVISFKGSDTHTSTLRGEWWVEGRNLMVLAKSPDDPNAEMNLMQHEIVSINYMMYEYRGSDGKTFIETKVKED